MFAQLPHHGERSAKKLVDAIGRARRVELSRFLIALGIPGVGSANARELARRFRTLGALRRVSLHRLRRTPGVGPALAAAVHGFFAEPSNQDAIDALLDAGIRVLAEPAHPDGRLAGKRFVFTGRLERFTRDEAESMVEALSARASDSVSGNTDYVVAGEDPGSKLDEARDRGVRVIDEAEFVRLVRRAGGDV